MRENVGPGDARGEVGGVGNRRHLVAEVSAGHDGPGGEPGGEAEGLAHAEQGQARRADGPEGGAGHEREDRADEHRADEEHGGREELQAPVEEQGDDTGLNPDPDERAHEEEDTGDDDDAVHAVDDTGFNLFPGEPRHDAEERGRDGGEHQRHEEPHAQDEPAEKDDQNGKEDNRQSHTEAYGLLVVHAGFPHADGRMDESPLTENCGGSPRRLFSRLPMA